MNPKTIGLLFLAIIVLFFACTFLSVTYETQTVEFDGETFVIQHQPFYKGFDKFGKHVFTRYSTIDNSNSLDLTSRVVCTSDAHSWESGTEQDQLTVMLLDLHSVKSLFLTAQLEASVTTTDYYHGYSRISIGIIDGQQEHQVLELIANEYPSNTQRMSDLRLEFNGDHVTFRSGYKSKILDISDMNSPRLYFHEFVKGDVRKRVAQTSINIYDIDVDYISVPPPYNPPAVPPPAVPPPDAALSDPPSDVAPSKNFFLNIWDLIINFFRRLF